MRPVSERQTREVDPIWLERRKWPDLPHYGHHVWPLGEDEHGLWLEIKIGNPVYRGDDLLFHGTSGGVMVLPPDGAPWLGWFPAAGDLELYVDIVCDVVRTPEAITMVDVDFDVVRMRDGRVELIDADEFDEHRVRYGYPDDVCAGAIAASQEVLAAVESGAPPFDGAAALGWAQRAGISLSSP